MSHSQNAVSNLAFANLFIKPERKANMDFITPHTNDKVCFMVPVPAAESKWLDLIKPFHFELWMAIMSFLLIEGLFITICARTNSMANFDGAKGRELIVRILLERSDNLVVTRR